MGSTVIKSYEIPDNINVQDITLENEYFFLLAYFMQFESSVIADYNLWMSNISITKVKFEGTSTFLRMKYITYVTI